MADVAVELTERTALRARGLKIIDVIAESQTVLITNPSYADEETRTEMEAIKTLLLGAVEAGARCCSN